MVKSVTSEKTRSAEILDALRIQSVNPGAWAGQWLTQTSTESFDSINPTTEEAIASVNNASPEDYERVVGRATDASRAWRTVPGPRRGELVRKIGVALRENKDALGTLVSLEMGKIKQEGDGEVQEMIDIADFAVGQSRMLYGKTMHSERPEHRMYEQWHPLGVVGVVTAFNFPVAVWAWNAMIAAVAGNTVVWKPSPKAPLCAIAVQHICNQVMQSEGYPGIFSLFVDSGNTLAERFVRDRRVALVSFTGSTAVGRQVSEAVAARLGKSLLELSGNNAVIVDETADLNLAIPAIVFGSLGTTGQRCTTTRRVFLHQAIYDEVISRLTNAYAQARIGDPLDTSVLMGPLVDGEAKNVFLSALAEVRNAGGRILFGGGGLERPGFFVEPCIAQAENHWEIVQRETFGPVLYVMKFNNLDDAVAMQNDVSQGLSSALFSNDLRNAERFLSHSGSDCGIANINIGTSGAEIGGAFGGEKDTGGGREAGSDAWQAYMRRQTTTINWGCGLPLAQGIKFEL
ncbi:MAG: aldehyde dehydrogenase family protein [Gammaproteobacteria bacterium]|nr:aldehyde dehydrogenase family protein [Gammaproteobacteria bacterium]